MSTKARSRGGGRRGGGRGGGGDRGGRGGFRGDSGPKVGELTSVKQEK